jgi:hypothetical protein
MKQKYKGFHKINYTAIDNFLRNNPSATYNDFKASHPNISISSFTFYARRKKLLGLSSISDKPHKARLYMRVWAKENSDPKVVIAIRDLITALNKCGRAHLEMVELANPSLIEVREVTK